VVDGRNDRQGADCQQGNCHDDLLRRLGFGAGPGAHAALKEIGVFDREINRDRQRAGKKDSRKQPCLNIVERPSG